VYETHVHKSAHFGLKELEVYIWNQGLKALR
jgi:hypothetical protein